MSYTYTGTLTAQSPNVHIFTSTDTYATITGSNYIGSDYSSILLQNDFVLMQYPTNLLGLFIVNISGGNLFLVGNGQYNTTGTSGGNFVTSPGTKTVVSYNGTAMVSNSKFWSGSATTTTGIATFHPTSDGTTSGTALFTTIHAGSAIAANNTTTPINYPFASLKAISGDLKTVTVNVGVGLNAVLSSPTIQNAPDGTTVYAHLIGA